MERIYEMGVCNGCNYKIDCELVDKGDQDELVCEEEDNDLPLDLLDFDDNVELDDECQDKWKEMSWNRFSMGSLSCADDFDEMRHTRKDDTLKLYYSHSWDWGLDGEDRLNEVEESLSEYMEDEDLVNL
jgi:hypothetical protein